ncbi:eukaryotic translation initiation factor 5B isoform X1 [Hydra vulgaris]|uniref:eukaryotic translation initiation factor 5B isoform X1 n=1 Tax=Hydra vulgaris TaxID=6087 RepID=UPI001F5F54A8|nr:eukaryotic translation initiation factor 5B isoform X1 [Hydra vulgaris]
MAKGKKSKKQDDNWDDDETVQEADNKKTEENENAHKKKDKKKKGKSIERDDDEEPKIVDSNKNADDDDVLISKKEKKKKKGRHIEQDDDEIMEEIDNKKVAENENAPKNKKDKKKKGKLIEREDDEDLKKVVNEDILNSKNKKKKNKEKYIDDDDEENEETVKPTHKSGFSALMIDDNEDDTNDDNLSSHEAEEVIKEVKSRKKGKKKKESAEDNDLAEILSNLEVSDQNKKAKTKKNKKKKEEDIESAYDEVNDMSIEPEKQVEAVASVKPQVKTEAPNKQETAKAVDNTNDEIKIKSAAEKKAEKKERDKKKKEKEKQKAAQQKKKEEMNQSQIPKAEDTQVEVSKEVPKEEIKKVTIEVSNETQKDGEEESGDETLDSKDKKKKKKKKKKEEDDKAKKIKKPGKSTILAMQEALEQVKKEEERLKAEAEAKARAIEKAEEERLEKIRLEKEKKERKKQREKERKEQLRREGKLLTPAQKEKRRKAEAMMELMKQKGIVFPKKEDVEKSKNESTEIEKPKKVMYGKKKKPQVKKVDTDVNDTKSEITVEQKEEVVDKVKEVNSVTVDSWDETQPSIKSDWAEDLDVKPVIIAEPKSEPKENKEVLTTQISESKESDDDDDESDEESDESESDSEEDSDSEDDTSSDEEIKLTPAMIRQQTREQIQKRRLANEARRSPDKLRAPVICVLGHVDTGKTKILDKIRRTNVQDGEAGGITQQIGATNIPLANIQEQTKMVKEFQKLEMKIPGLLVIDTPGHESFSNLRSRGSNLCDMAILVVDLMHGLEQQTIESINLLKSKKTPFVVALNKIDRVYEWKKSPQTQVEDTIKMQKKVTVDAFNELLNLVIRQFAEQGLNAALHFKNPDEKSYISLVPTSAHSGDGMGDLLALICRLTQSRLAKKLSFSEELESTVMEVKALPGLGTTIDVILVNGKLKEGDTIVTGGIEGAIVTQIRSILTPQPMRELRVKGQYIHHQEIEAAQGVKLCAKDLEKVLAGSPLYVAQSLDEVDVLKEDVDNFVSSSLKAINVSERGVYVQASTLGSLEALLEFLKTSKIPYCGVNIGPVHKKDIMRCSVMLEHEPMYAVILAFDVKIEKDVQEFADREGVRIFSAEIIYHLFDQFTAYCEDYKTKKRDEFKHLAVYPVKLRIMPQHIFNTRDPIVFGVVVEGGTLRLGTPIVVPSQNNLMIGFVTGIEANHKQQEKAATGQEVCVKIDAVPGEAPKLYGRHFTHEDLLVSKITRDSIDVMKQYFREDMQKSDWQLVIELKKLLEIV